MGDVKLWIVIWASVIGSGILVVVDYGAAPGDPGAPSSRWPNESRVEQIAGVPNLVMAIHPRCPCTRASLRELSVLMTASGDRLSAHVLACMPTGAPPGWERTDLWRRAESIPGVSVQKDVDGADAMRFGARVSGHALLYDDGGRLRFSGGITAARGHEGDNAGRDAVLTQLAGRPSDEVQVHPVFGCALLGTTAEPEEPTP